MKAVFKKSVLSVVVFLLLSCTARSGFAAGPFAAGPQRMVVIDTDEAPGDSFIDIVQDESGAIESLEYDTGGPVLIFTIAQLRIQSAVLMQQSGRNVVMLNLDPAFDVVTGGFVNVQFLNNGFWGTYKDFRILINVGSDAITFQSDPNPNDPISDGNSYKAVFNKLFFWTATFWGQDIGVDHVTPSMVPQSELDAGRDLSS